MDQAESQVLALDFVNDLQSGESISTSSWTIAVAPNSEGVDATPSARLIGGSSILSTTVTAQRVATLVPDVNYVLQALVTTTLSNTLSLFSHVQGETVE